FFFIMLAYYQIKPASRSLFIGQLGADRLPYVWIGTALMLGLIISGYHRLVARYSRLGLVLGSTILSMLALVAFRVLLTTQSAPVALAFYVFVDIFGVVLVEQFWSLSNTLYSSAEGKRWYGFLSTGGVLGGLLGAGAATLVLNHTALTTPDLLLVAVAILALVVVINLALARYGVFRAAAAGPLAAESRAPRPLLRDRYLLLVGATVLLAQVVEPLVEYEFMKMVEQSYTELDTRTGFISWLFTTMGLVAMLVNLCITPMVHRYLGVVAGLMTQPLLLLFCTFGFIASPGLMFGSAMKVSDRGLSYSINRASKELLYIPVDPIQSGQAKAWIDMFGYRAFKVIGALLILLLTGWLPLHAGLVGLGWLTVSVCVLWLVTVVYLAREYRGLYPQPAAA
ncbi:MAG: hypothetical protein L0Z62_00550, partial [Gemmataceae bacterium]|nr:hypothetical protein [Gemmataceae bacterium]